MTITTVPASEYDALCDILEAIVDDAYMGGPGEAVGRVLLEFSDVEADWLDRILTGERSQLLAGAPGKGRNDG